MNSMNSFPSTPKDFLELAVEQGTPRYLYQYRSKDKALRFLKSMQLYFATASEFNDPYDCNLELVNDSTEEDWLRFFQGTGLMQPAECKLHARRMMFHPDEGIRYIEDAIRRQQKKTGILCLTTKNNDNLMWAHYADSHQGICIQYDILQDPVPFFFPKKVDYDTHTIRFNYIKDQAPATEALFHKHSDWAYEEEYRIVKISTHGLCPVSPLAVREIIFGCKMLPEDRQEIIDLCRNKGYRHIHFAEVQKGKDYQLSIQPLGLP